MTKTSLVLALILFLCGCSVFQSKSVPYPDGILFPLKNAGEFPYEGEIVDLIQKKDHCLYFVTDMGFVYCVDAQDYTLLWRFSEMKSPPKSPVYLGQSRIFVFDDVNTIYCLDLDGKVLWDVRLEEEITSPLTEIGNALYLGTSGGRFIALDIFSGNEAWSVQAEAAIRSNPVFFEEQVIFGCDDHLLYFVDQNGHLAETYLAKDRILNTLLVDGKFLYFGTENHYFVCLDLKKRVKKWEVRTGGRVLPVPVSDHKRVFFLAWNNVLYCLNKRTGSILWWRPIPSRSLFPLELERDRIVVSSMSSQLVCFDVSSGRRVGDYDVGSEVKSNSLWNPPFLLTNVYDRETGTGRILKMEKDVHVTLTPSVKSPQFVNQEITLTASAIGFFLPRYEFYINNGEERTVVQAEADKSTWTWFPSQFGTYSVGVMVKDEKVTHQAEIPYVIKKVEPTASLSPSKPSPQAVKQDIIITARSRGISDPLYDLRISSVNLISIGKRSICSVIDEKRERVVFEKSESDNWVWVPLHPGLYKFSLIVSNDNESVHMTRYYLIIDEKNSQSVKQEGDDT